MLTLANGLSNMWFPLETWPDGPFRFSLSVVFSLADQSGNVEMTMICQHPVLTIWNTAA